jgi:predicted protein tyrosine phosphatase
MFAGWSVIETSSAGPNHDPGIPVAPELLQWADIVFVLERALRFKLLAKFKPFLGGARGLSQAALRDCHQTFPPETP